MAKDYLLLEASGKFQLEDGSGFLLLDVIETPATGNGADLYGFDPFTGFGRSPGPDFAPGPLSAWKPTELDVNIALDYAQQVFNGTRDISLLRLLGHNSIGARV